MYSRFSTGCNQFLPKDGIITFTAHSPHYSLPNRNLLRAHAVVAKILHVTGMGELIDEVFQKQQDIRCFAPDGTTNVQSLLTVF